MGIHVIAYFILTAYDKKLSFHLREHCIYLLTCLSSQDVWLDVNLNSTLFRKCLESDHSTTRVSFVKWFLIDT